MKKSKSTKAKVTSVVNRRASFDYALGDELTTGVVLNGRETRAARDGHIQLKGSFVTVRNHELWINNASFSIKINEKGKTGERTLDSSPRKLLATKKQIESLEKSKKTGMSIVPIKLLTGGRHVKLIIALGKGKKTYDKRETLKRRDADREASRLMRQR